MNKPYVYYSIVWSTEHKIKARSGARFPLCVEVGYLRLLSRHRRPYKGNLKRFSCKLPMNRFSLQQIEKILQLLFFNGGVSLKTRYHWSMPCSESQLEFSSSYKLVCGDVRSSVLSPLFLHLQKSISRTYCGLAYSKNLISVGVSLTQMRQRLFVSSATSTTSELNRTIIFLNNYQ